MGEEGRTAAELRVLVVEDEPLQRWMLGEHLRQLGVGYVSEAEDGDAALRCFQETAFDLVLTDLNMPGMDGIGFLRQLSGSGRQCPVAITSAMGADLLRLVEEALAESGSRLLAVLPKPVAPEQLEALLARAAAQPRTPLATPGRRATVNPAEVYAALAAGVFEPHFQPKVDVASGRTVAVEALARWPHPARGWVSPAEFIPILEQDGGIVDLTLLLLEKVCASLKRIEAAGFPLKAAINLSRSLFARGDVVERISDIAAAAGLAPERFILEITETAVENDPGNMLASLARLKMKGFRLSIDDFGTGYSSMLALVRVPFDELKIDRSFVTGATRNPRSRIVLEATIQLAARLGQSTVAEGVETVEELDLLRAVGCHEVQGYLYAPALPEERLAAWLRERAGVALSLGAAGGPGPCAPVAGRA